MVMAIPIVGATDAYVGWHSCRCQSRDVVTYSNVVAVIPDQSGTYFRCAGGFGGYGRFL